MNKALFAVESTVIADMEEKSRNLCFLFIQHTQARTPCLLLACQGVFQQTFPREVYAWHYVLFWSVLKCFWPSLKSSGTLKGLIS